MIFIEHCKLGFIILISQDLSRSVFPFFFRYFIELCSFLRVRSVCLYADEFLCTSVILDSVILLDVKWWKRKFSLFFI